MSFKLYDYQQKALDSTLNEVLGQIVLPTGSGKTIIEAAILANEVRDFGIYVVNSPRIILTFQLLKEVYSFLTKSNIDARYMFVHSGGTNDEADLEEIRKYSKIKYSQILASTSVDEILKIVHNSFIDNLPLILFSTYHSAFKIEQVRKKFDPSFKINMVLNDEAHYLVQEQFHSMLDELTFERSFFFTATTLHTISDNGRGMNNVDKYGKVLFEMTPLEAIRLGKMVRPRLHFVTTHSEYNSEDYRRSLPKIIYESFYQHAEVLTTLMPKILISVKGTNDIVRFLKSLEYLKLRSDEVNILAIASNDLIANDVNGAKVSRQSFLKTLKKIGENDSKKLIVLHFDIIAEGIDISGFTGMLPLRGLSKSKFLQTFGRCSRLNKIDRDRLTNGSLQYDCLEDFIKPYAYIIVPDIVQDNEDSQANIIKLINELRSNGFEPYESMVISESINGVPVVSPLANLNDLSKRMPNLGRLINDLEKKIESEEDAGLDKLDFLNKVLTL